MTILFDASRTVKPTSFGRGLFAYSPARKFADRTVSDEAEVLAWEIARQEEAAALELAPRVGRLMTFEEHKAAIERENEMIFELERKAAAELERQAELASYEDELARWNGYARC